MIKRYSLPKMAKIWEMENRFQFMLNVEIAACKAMHKFGIIPTEDLENIIQKADFEIAEIEEIEAKTKHDVIAFLTSVSRHIGPSSRWLHYGLTSSDVLDTATSVQLKKAGEMILADLLILSKKLHRKAIEHKNTICVGRSHGIHAEPTVFGLKFALWFDENRRNIARMKRAIEVVSVGQLSGAIGNYAHLSPEIEKEACNLLGIQAVNISTQVIQRDRIAEFLSTIAIIGSSIEKMAVEIRHLQRTEVGEAEENFSGGQKGSSAMPHKKNPIVSENLSGCARLLRSNLVAALENNALWHERDISHSSVERVILPDSTILVNYMLVRTIKLIEMLVVHPQKMLENLNITNGLVFSQSLLLELAKSGITREEAYKIVQTRAMKCFNEKISFKDYVLNDKEISKLLSKDVLFSIFSFEKYTKNVDYIYKKVGISE